VSGPREAVEQAILASVGLAALTKERIEGIVADLVAHGTISAEDGAAVASRLFARIRGEGPPAHAGILGRLEDGAKAAFREMGLATKTDLEEMRVRLAELERRLVLLEGEPPSD
jgi:polyhydroxyalkanoate synthesis regulator phasin